MELLGIDKVEDLHHDEGVEDESEVSRKDSVLAVNWSVVIFTVDEIQTAASDCTTDDAVLPFVLRVAGEDASVVRVLVLRDQLVPGEHQNHNHDELENGLSDDVLEHCSRNYVLVS